MQSMRLYISFYDDKISNPNLRNHLIGPGMVCFTGEKYIVMRSPEIEEYAFGSLSYTNNNLGIAKLRTNSLGLMMKDCILLKFQFVNFILLVNYQN